MVIRIHNLNETKPMKINHKIATLFFVILALFTSFLHAETLDKVVAIVNDDVITQSEFREAANHMVLQLRASGQQANNDAAFKKRIINFLIEKKIQLQIAKQLHLKIDEKELNTIIGRIAAQNNMTNEQLIERIKLEGLNVTVYKDNLREQLLLQKL